VPFVPDHRTLRPRARCLWSRRRAHSTSLPSPAGSGGYARLRADAIEATVSGLTVRIAWLDDLIAI